MLAYRQGDAGAFETLYARHKGPLYRFVLRSVRGADLRAVATGLGDADPKKNSAKSRLSPAMPERRARELAAALTRESDSPLSADLAAHPRAAQRRRFTRAAFASLVGAAVAAVLRGEHPESVVNPEVYARAR